MKPAMSPALRPQTQRTIFERERLNTCICPAHTGVFNRRSLATSPKIGVVIERKTFIAAGFENVTTSSGLLRMRSGPRLKGTAELQRHLIAYCADQAGNRGREIWPSILTGGKAWTVPADLPEKAWTRMTTR